MQRVKAIAGVLVILLLVCAPVQAAFIANFEAPGYTTGSVNGQNGWSVTAGTGVVQANTTLDGAQLLSLPNSAVQHALSVTDFGTNTSISFLTNFTGTIPVFSELDLKDTSGNTYAIVGADSGAGGRFYYWTNPAGPSGFVPVVDNSIDVPDGKLEMTVTLHFATSTYDILFQNLANSDSHLVTGLALSPTMAAAAGTLVLQGLSARVDDVSVGATVPEPATLSLLAVGIVVSLLRVTWRRHA